MLHNLIAAVTGGEIILVWIEYAALAIEVLAVIIIAFSIFYNVVRYIFKGQFLSTDEIHYQALKRDVGRSLLLGLEILVAADIVRTIALEATFESVAVLGLLVVIRTFLSWSLVVEIDHRWPWQSHRETGGAEADQ